MIAVVPVRDGRLPAGADAVVRECAGRVLVVGEGTRAAVASIRTPVLEATAWEAGPFAPARWAEGLAALLVDEPHVVLPGAPDGRDLLARLAHAMSRPCFAGCTAVAPDEVVMTRHDGAASVTVPVSHAFVATLLPFASPPGHVVGDAVAEVRTVDRAPDRSGSLRDADVVAVEDADPGELDLADADRIVAGGVGLGGADEFAVLGEVATALGASLGATRPVADRGIVGHERQIGTTGVAVDPTLYLAFGISGAVQHTAGLGAPRRIVAVNTDAACPMMAMADLAVVADAAGTLDALVRRLGEAAP